MESQLKDPYSAQYILDRVYRGYCKKGWLKGKGLDWIGWAANIRINAKNSYGAYGGYEPYTVFFSGDSAVKAVEGANFGAYGPSKGVLGLDGGAGVCAVPKLTPEGSAPLDPNKPRLGIGFLAVPDGAYVGAVERGNVGDRSGIKVGIDVLPRLLPFRGRVRLLHDGWLSGWQPVWGHAPRQVGRRSRRGSSRPVSSAA